ncbi:MAG: hypothetical protein U1G07_22430 [Verrucomicrobiota bacterium]
MKHCALIANRPIRSEHAFIVYGTALGLFAESDEWNDIHHHWAAELARRRERGQEFDAYIFEWREDHWALCGSLYDMREMTAR